MRGSIISACLRRRDRDSFTRRYRHSILIFGTSDEEFFTASAPILPAIKYFNVSRTSLTCAEVPMNVTVERTLFLLDLGTMEVTICTWQGEEASLSVSHLCSLVDYVRSCGIPLPPSPPAIAGEHEPEKL